MLDTVQKIINKEKEQLNKRGLAANESNQIFKHFFYNLRDILASIPDDMRNEFVINTILSDNNFLNPNILENAIIEYDKIDTIVRSVGLLEKSPKSLLRLPRDINDIVVCGNVMRITRRKDNLIVSTITRMVNMNQISDNYMLNFDKLEKTQGIEIGVMEKQLVLNSDSVISVSELNYIEKMPLKYMKWFGRHSFFYVVDCNSFARIPSFEKANEVLTDQDIVLDQVNPYCDISSYEKACQHLSNIADDDFAPLTEDRVSYLHAQSLNNSCYDTDIYTIERNTLKVNEFMRSSKVRTLIPKKEHL